MEEKNVFIFSVFPIAVLIFIWIIALILLVKLIFESEENRLPRFAALLSSSIVCYYLYLKDLLYSYFIELNKIFSNFIILSLFVILSFSFGMFLGWFLSESRKGSSDRKARAFILITSFYLGFIVINFCKSKFLITPFSEFTLFPSFGMLFYYTFWRQKKK